MGKTGFVVFFLLHCTLALLLLLPTMQIKKPTTKGKHVVIGMVGGIAFVLAGAFAMKIAMSEPAPGKK